MSRTLQISSIILAVLYALSFGSYQWLTRHSVSGSELLFFDCCTLAGYIVLAIFWRNAGQSAWKIGVIAMFLAGTLPVLTGLVQTFLFPNSVTDSPAAVQDSKWWETVFVGAYCLVFGWVAWMSARPAPARRMRSNGFLLVLGVILISSSLFLVTTYPDNYGIGSKGEGWRVLDRQEEWITGHASVGQSAFMGHTIKWLQPIFPATGYSLYTLTIIASIVTLVVASLFRFSIRQLATSKTFTRITAFLSLASVWIVTDVHWGWHFNFADYPAAAVLGTLTWFAMLLGGCFAGWRIARGSISPALISWLRFIQLPMIAFNLMLLRAYFEHDSFVPLHGLATLLLGLPILSWVCQQILLARDTEKEKFALGSPHGEELSSGLAVAGR